MQSYDYIITLNKRKKIIISYWKTEKVLNLQKLGSTSSKDALCPVGPVLLAQWYMYQRRIYLNFFTAISPFLYYHLLEIGMVLHLNEIKSTLSMDVLCKVQLKLA